MDCGTAADVDWSLNEDQGPNKAQEGILWFWVRHSPVFRVVIHKIGYADVPNVNIADSDS